MSTPSRLEVGLHANDVHASVCSLTAAAGCMWPALSSSLHGRWRLQTCPAAGDKAFDFPCTTFYGSQDRRITADMVRGWQRFTTAGFECLSVEGHHLWPLDKQAKTAWLGMIVERLNALSL